MCRSWIRKGPNRLSESLCLHFVDIPAQVSSEGISFSRYQAGWCWWKRFCLLFTFRTQTCHICVKAECRREICAVKKYLNSREYFTIECFFCESHEHAHTRRKVKRDTMESCGQWIQREVHKAAWCTGEEPPPYDSIPKQSSSVCVFVFSSHWFCVVLILYLFSPHVVFVFFSCCICAQGALRESPMMASLPSVCGGTTSGANSHHMSSFNHHSLFSPLLKNPPLSSTLSKSPVNLTTTKTHCLFKILLSQMWRYVVILDSFTQQYLTKCSILFIALILSVWCQVLTVGLSPYFLIVLHTASPL